METEPLTTATPEARHVTPDTPAAALDEAIERAGGRAMLGRALDISGQAISQWDRCPAERVLAVEAASGVSRHRLRPDLYPLPNSPTSEAAT